MDLVDVETAAIETLGGADTVIVQGTGGRDVVQATRSGSQVTVAGLPAEIHVTDTEAGVDTLQVATLAGNDDVTVGMG